MDMIITVHGLMLNIHVLSLDATAMNSIVIVGGRKMVMNV
jgi:hypothetical protein